MNTFGSLHIEQRDERLLSPGKLLREGVPLWRSSFLGLQGPTCARRLVLLHLRALLSREITHAISQDLSLGLLLVVVLLYSGDGDGAACVVNMLNKRIIHLVPVSAD